MEASLWTEMIRSPQQAEHMLYPRLLAVAERAWHIAEWETMGHHTKFDPAYHGDWLKFAVAVSGRELRRLDKLGINYRLPRPGF